VTLSTLNSPARLLRDALRESDRGLAERFTLGENVEDLLLARADRVDDVVQRAWRMCFEPGDRAALLALGGYGRGALFPRSDIDLLVLVPERDGAPAAARLEERIGRFVALLWDAGLQVGHSVRTLDGCLTAAASDHQLATALLEARPLAGDELCGAVLIARAADLWGPAAFLAAKRDELEVRHLRQHDAAYRLEPDVKDGPGGLRDLNAIGWLAHRVLGADQPGADAFDALAEHGVLTASELELLREGHAFLARIRCALHLLAGRREERLSFDAQLRLARQFGFEDLANERAVESFMRRFFRTVGELGMLRELVFVELERRAATDASGSEPFADDPRFANRDGLVELCDPARFEREPGAMLDAFLLMQRHPGLRGFGPTTLRGLRAARGRIDAGFRADPRHRAAFMALLRGEAGVTHELRRMARYGVLGRIIPAFGAVEGRTQFDLFHAYPVDEHTLFVVSNLRRFALSRYDHEFPACSRLMQALPRPEVVYLAGLFHDIAKGQGGDHSELGADEAEAFCLAHELSPYDAHLVSWLVRNHLLLSVTAQKRDLSDPGVIRGFAAAVGDELHLDCLYLLTIADVRGTNPDLWNSWKARLFHDLHAQARAALRRGLEAPIDAIERIAATRASARAELEAAGQDGHAVEALWARFGAEYFLRHTPAEVAWHAAALIGHRGEAPLVAVGTLPDHGGAAVLVCAPAAAGGFVRATAALERLGLSVLDARIAELDDGRALQTYVVLEDGGQPLDDPERRAEVRSRVAREMMQLAARPAALARRAPRQVRLFMTRPDVRFADPPVDGRTVVELTAGDRPGLLCDVGQVFDQLGVRVHAARITTVGERAEDVFYVTDRAGLPLADAGVRAELVALLRERLAPSA